MARYTWRPVVYGFWKEATRWTAVAPAIWVPLTEKWIMNKNEYIEDESSLFDIFATRDSEISKSWAEGTLGWNLQLNSIWYLFLTTLWQVTSAETTGTWAYEHTFSTLQTNEHPSLTIAKSHPITWDEAFALGMINSFTITADLNWYLTFSADIRAKKGEGASYTVAETTDYKLITKSGWMYLADTLDWINTVSTECLKSFEIVFEKNLEDVDCLFSESSIDYINKQFSITWSFTADFMNSTYKSLYENGTAKAMRVIFNNPNVTIWVEDNPTLQFDFSKIKITEFEATEGNDDIISQTATFTAYKGEDGKHTEVKIINTHPTY